MQPVFDAIVQSAKRVFGALTASATRVVGDSVHLAAFSSTDPGGEELLKRQYPLPIADNTLVGEAVRTKATVIASDVQTDPRFSPARREVARARGYRSMLVAPMLRDGVVIGTIDISRAEPGPFSDHHVALLKAFADQAVIAIQNTRLFNETKEALSHQTATADILRVISGSPTDVQPVFDAIARNSVTLCGSLFANVFRFDGELIHWVSSDRYASNAVEILRRTYPSRPSLAQVSGRVLLTNSVVRMEDVLADPVYDHRFAHAGGWRRMLGVPMLREGNPIGVIVVGWAETGPIPKSQEELLKTFADQAVIAIENVRLFNETKVALERQTATAEVLRVISESPTEVQPVLEAVAQRAGLLCRADGSRVWLVVDGQLRATTGYGPAYEVLFASDVLPLRRTSIGGRSVLERRHVHVEDVLPLIESEYPDMRGVPEALRIPHGAERSVAARRRSNRRDLTAAQRVRPFAPAEIACCRRSPTRR